MWLENNWDHRMLIWKEDPLIQALEEIDPTIVAVPFNPTAENIGEFILQQVAPLMLVGTGVRLVKVEIEETRKCSVTCSIIGEFDVK